MASKVLNIEVGDDICKVCCALSVRTGCRVTDSFMFRTPVDCVTDGAINNPEVLADMLTVELDKHELRGIKAVAFSVASGKIASREVKLPFMKNKALADAVQTNAADYFPVDVTRYHVTYKLLERQRGAEGFTRVLVLAAPLTLLEGYFKLAEFAKLDIKSVDSCSNSHYELIRKLKEPRVSMYVDVDCAASFVSFIQGDELLLQRTFTFGGGDLISSYMTNKEYGEGEFVRALNEINESNAAFAGYETIGETVIYDALSRLVYNIVRSVDYFNSFRWENATAQIVLTGPCGHMAGLKEQVAAATELPTIYLEEIPGADGLCSGADLSAYIGCIGCGIAPVDFMPDYLKRRKKGLSMETQETTLVKGAIGCGILVLAAAATVLLSVSEYNNAERQLEQAKAEIESLEPAEQTYLTYTAYQQGEQAMLQVRSLEESPNAQLAAFFEELEEKMPSQILVLSAVCTPEGVSMNITVPGLEEAAVVLSQLRSFESLSSVTVSGIITESGEEGTAKASFTLDCTYGENPYLNNTNPYGDQIGAAAETGEDEQTEQTGEPVPAGETEAQQ